VDPGHKEQASIGGVSFSCPNGFTLQRSDSNYRVAYMRHDREDLALFVAIPRPSAGDEYVEHLGSYVASYLFPQEWAVFAWKRLASTQKVSKFETGGGVVNGFNGAQAVTLDYKRLQLSGAEVIAGYIVGAGRDEAAEGHGRSQDAGSAAGRFGVAHVIASITGEKYADLTAAQNLTTSGSQSGDGGTALASKPLSGLKEAIQATVARFRRDKISLPANFSLALTFNISEKGEAVNLSIIQSSGLKKIDEAAAEILRRAGDLGVLGLLNVSGSIRTTLELGPASAHFLIAWPLADEQQSLDKATRLSFLLKLVAAQQRKKNPAIGEALGLIRCGADGKMVVVEMTAPRDRWSEWVRAWFGSGPAPDSK
jgi:hypothetical protein